MKKMTKSGYVYYSTTGILEVSGPANETPDKDIAESGYPIDEELKYQDSLISSLAICPMCKSGLSNAYNYCPWCGEKRSNDQ